MVACKICGRLMQRDLRASYCFDCYARRVKQRLAAPGRVLNGSRKPHKVGDRWACVDCGGEVRQDFFNGKKRRPAMRCSSCDEARMLFLEVLSGRNAAALTVANARRAGLVPPPHDFACADCGRPAECYDHRDYGEPLKIDPVCRSCNIMRGSARPLNQLIVSALVLAHFAEGVG